TERDGTIPEALEIVSDQRNCGTWRCLLNLIWLTANECEENGLVLRPLRFLRQAPAEFREQGFQPGHADIESVFEVERTREPSFDPGLQFRPCDDDGAMLRQSFGQVRESCAKIDDVLQHMTHDDGRRIKTLQRCDIEESVH